MTTRPTDRDRADPELDELDDDPLRERDHGSLPARRSQPPAPTHETFSAVFGECTRSGRWSAADDISAGAWFGEVKLDFRDAEIAADGVVEVEATAIFGQVTLVVPKNTEVDLGGVSALFGGVSTKEGGKLRSMARRLLTGDDEDYDDDPDDPDWEPMVLRVTGTVVFGAVEVVLE